MGSVVELLDMKKNQKKKFQIVGTNEASPVDGKISDESPIGKAVMKKKVGERFTVEAPVGTLEFEVLDISLSL